MCDDRNPHSSTIVGCLTGHGRRARMQLTRPARRRPAQPAGPAPPAPRIPEDFMPDRRVGLWLIGALGGIGSTVALGLAALHRGRTGATALVTALPLFDRLDLDG